MSDPINTDGTVPEQYAYANWERLKWGNTTTDSSVGAAAASLCNTLDPLAHEFAPSKADMAAVTVTRAGPWLVAGEWKWRELGREVQLRNKRLPHLTIDLFRSEAEVLYQALGLVLSKPAPLPYRAPWHERLRMWWMRVVWNRRNARELDEHRAALLKEFANPDRSPWG